MKVDVQEAGKPTGKKFSGWRTRLTRRNIKLVLAVLGVLAVGILVWQYLEAKSELNRYTDPVKAVEKESKDLVSQVGQVMVLPQGEQPVPAEVSDESRFANNPAFEGVKNGDKLLIYQEKRKVIIYRPSTNQIVNVITVAADQAVPTQ